MDEQAFFFLGNCQTQYLAAMIGAVSRAERWFLGHRYGVNLALDGPAVACVDKKPFFAAVAAATKSGRRTVLVLQETSHSRFARRMAPKAHLFDDVVLIPHVGFKSQWPDPDKDGVPLSDRKVRRMFDWERHEFIGKLERSGMADSRGFADTFWERCRRELRFYHPGHPTGALFAELLEALRPGLSGPLPFLDLLLTALRRSDGIYQNSNHTVEPRVGELLDLEWARSDLYRAWQGVDRTEEPEPLRAAVLAAQAVFDDPAALAAVAPPFAAHFRAALGQAYVRLGERERGVEHMSGAAIALKGHGPLVRRTLNQAARARRPDVVEHLLTAVAPHLDVQDDDHPGYRTAFGAVLGMRDGPAVLSRVRDAAESHTWMHGYLDRLLAAA